MNKELAKNTIIIFLGKACTQLISFLLLPLYTTYLTTSDYGTVDLIITYVSLLVPVITIQLEMAAFRFLVDNRNDKKEISKIITNILYCVLSFATIFTLVYVIVLHFVNFPYKWFILLNILVTVLSNLILQIARGLGNNKVYSIGSCVAGVTTIISNVILIVCLKYGAKGMLISTIIANIMCYIYVFTKLKVYRYINKELFDKEIIKKALKYSWPLVPNGISWWIINVSDRTIISWILGVSANGIYAVSNKFSGIMTSVLNIFSLSWTESAALHINDKDKDIFFSRSINIILKFIISIVLIIIAIMPFVFNILIGKEYSEAYLYIPILMLSTIFNGVVILYSGVYIAKKMTKQVASTSIMSAVLNIIINLLLIKYIGIYAAAISTALSYLVMAIYRHYDLKKYVNIVYEKNLILKNLIMYIIIMMIYYYNHWYTNIIGILIVSIYLIKFNRELISSSINFVKEKLNYLKSINKKNEI